MTEEFEGTAFQGRRLESFRDSTGAIRVEGDDLTVKVLPNGHIVLTGKTCVVARDASAKAFDLEYNDPANSDYGVDIVGPVDRNTPPPRSKPTRKQRESR
jgi:hypothetical protein